MIKEPEEIIEEEYESALTACIRGFLKSKALAEQRAGVIEELRKRAMLHNDKTQLELLGSLLGLENLALTEHVITLKVVNDSLDMIAQTYSEIS